jgi:hypothetical protein
MVRKTTYILFIIFASVSVSAQTEASNDDEFVREEVECIIPFDSLDTKDKMHYSFEVGAGFGQSNTFGNYFSTYYKPMVSYDVSPRFSVNTGIVYVNSSVENVPVISDYNYQLFSGNISQYYAFVGGKYKLTDKLSVGGSVFYDFTSYNSFDGTSLSASSGLDNLGATANFKFKVSDHLSIEGELRLNDKSRFNQLYTPFHSQTLGMNNMFFGR